MPWHRSDVCGKVLDCSLKMLATQNCQDIFTTKQGDLSWNSCSPGGSSKVMIRERSNAAGEGISCTWSRHSPQSFKEDNTFLFFFFSQSIMSGVSEKLATGRALIKIIVNIHWLFICASSPSNFVNTAITSFQPQFCIYKMGTYSFPYSSHN